MKCYLSDLSHLILGLLRVKNNFDDFQNHRESRQGLHIPKVAFLVEQSALAEQQGKVCEEYLACEVKVITGEKQRTESLQNLSCWIQKYVNKKNMYA